MELTATEQAQVDDRVKNHGQSPILAYILWLAVGIMGIHRFYCKNKKAGAISLALFILTMAALFTPITLQMPEYVECMQKVTQSPDYYKEESCILDVAKLSSASRASMLTGLVLGVGLILWWLFDALSLTAIIRKNNGKLSAKFSKEVIQQRSSRDA